MKTNFNFWFTCKYWEKKSSLEDLLLSSKNVSYYANFSIWEVFCKGGKSSKKVNKKGKKKWMYM